MTVPPGTSDFSLSRDLAPGKYNATVNSPASPPLNFDVEFGADTSSVIALTEDYGIGTIQVYPSQ
jgi:hypothetical protein